MTDFHDLTHDDIDWNQLWLNARRKKGWADKGAAEWDKKAPSFSDRNRTSPYIELLLAQLPLEPEMTVLDVGSGPGTLSLPLARKTRRVTAIDFSARMIEILGEEAERQHLDNITTCNCSWEDDWQAWGIKPHDIAIASRSLSVDDLSGAIAKLDGFATRYVFISDRINPTPYAPEAFAAVGRPFHPGPDYIYTLNTLYAMGIHPNVTLLELDRELHCRDLDEAYLAYVWMIKDINCDEEKRLKSFLERQAQPAPDGSIVIRRPIPPRWALIWWAKPPVADITDSTRLHKA